MIVAAPPRLSSLGAALACCGALATASAQTAMPMPSMSPAASAANGPNGPVPSADKAFMHKAAIGGMAEVEMGKLAEHKASNDQVKQFGARMVQDHGKANGELKQIASGKGVMLPTSLDKKNQGTMDRMHKLSGAAFDKSYMSHMVDDHKKDIADFQKESKNGNDAEVKGFASKTLPTLQEHLTMAQDANSAVKSAK